MSKASSLNLRGAVPQKVQDSTPELSETPETAEISSPKVVAQPEVNQDLSGILKTLQNLQSEVSEVKKENAKLKEFSQLSVFEAQKNGKERYNGPSAYSYKLYEGKPICSLEMTTNHVLLNSNTGRYVANQTIKLTFPDGETKDVDYEIFSQRYMRSEKIFPKEVKDLNGVKTYKFEINGEDFTVDSSAIN